ncbi:hypothetical protein PoB_002362900 [Plakobranchus ocellatus]|uniref:Uncharacterized protein n=1 Tax=Plakobranchus ocellatus TaxID=259542 RepID=A0AAV3ZP77_9GAST|nr:hypothetical protein PoB_002362900 [Plakobranchus ocellatus]
MRRKTEEIDSKHVLKSVITTEIPFSMVMSGPVNGGRNERHESREAKGDHELTVLAFISIIPGTKIDGACFTSVSARNTTNKQEAFRFGTFTSTEDFKER